MKLKRLLTFVLLIAMIYLMAYPVGALSLYFLKLWCGMILSLLAASVLILTISLKKSVFNTSCHSFKVNGFLRIGLFLSIVVVFLSFELQIFCFNLGFIKKEKSQWGIFDDIQYPLGNPESIVVDKKGDIFLALNSYGRIQKYDAKGHFLKGWFVGSVGGEFVIWTEQGLLHVFLGRPRIHKTYDFDGNLVSSQKVYQKGSLGSFFQKGKLDQKDMFGNSYSIQNGLQARVIKKDFKGEEESLIEDTFWRWFTCFPYPNFYIVIVGTMISGFFVLRKFCLGVVGAKKLVFPLCDAQKSNQE